MFELGREVTKTVDGKAYTFSRLERRLVEAWRDWISDQIGDPFALVERFLDKMPPDEAKVMIAEAKSTKQQLESFSMGCPLSQRFLKTEIGMGHLAYLQLRGKHPDITEEEAFNVILQLGAREAAKIVDRTSGAAPGKNAAVPATH